MGTNIVYVPNNVKFICLAQTAVPKDRRLCSRYVPSKVWRDQTETTNFQRQINGQQKHWFGSSDIEGGGFQTGETLSFMSLLFEAEIKKLHAGLYKWDVCLVTIV